MYESSTVDMFRPFGASRQTGEMDDDTATAMWRRFMRAKRWHAPSRRLQRRDQDVYDGYQWDSEDKDYEESRGRPALTINLVQPTVNLVLGQERANRLDMVARPVGQSDVDGANAMTQYLKYTKETSDADLEISTAFASAVIRGEGWLEVDLRTREMIRDDLGDGLENEPFIRSEDSEFVFVDPLSRRNDLSDARYVIRAIWVDLDEAQAMFPDFADQLAELLANPADFDESFLQEVDEETLPDPWQDVDEWMADTTGKFVDQDRHQVLLVECQYRSIEPVQMIVLPDVGAVPFDRANPQHVQLLDATPDEDLETLFPKVRKKRMRVAITCGPLLLQDDPSPHLHGQFSLVPIFGYRDRQGRAYGLVRPLIDAQMEYNKRRSTALYLLAARRVLFESGSVKSVAKLLEMAADPQGAIEVNDGSLQKQRIRFERDADMAPAHIQLMQLSKEEIEQNSGVNQEMKGFGPGDQSGRAIMARQAQGNLMLGVITDNYRLALKRVAQIVLSLARQYLTKPKELRLTEAPTGKEWLTINGPNGVSIAQTKANATIEEAPSTPTVRQENLRVLQEFMQQMPPEIRMALLPDIIEASDIPSRDRLKFTAEEVLRRMGFLPPPGGGPVPAMMGPPPGMAQPPAAMPAAATMPQ